jgi:NAD+ kinase
MIRFSNIAIIARPNSKHLESHVLKVAYLLLELGLTPFIDNQFELPDQLQNYSYTNIDEILPKLDLIIVIGGDGTMLSIARKLVYHDIPLIGINQGKLGFITDVSIDDVIPVLNAMIIKHEFITEERNLIVASIQRGGAEVYKNHALNDVVIYRGAMGNMIEFSMYINQEMVFSQKSDGLIFATPTGSTAYSLAAGGPILHPNSKVISIVPVCPQSMSNRPIVVNDDVNIQVNILSGTEAVIHSDGQEHLALNTGDIITIYKSESPVKLLHPQNYSYYKTLRNKLHWAKRLS